MVFFEEKLSKIKEVLSEEIKHSGAMIRTDFSKVTHIHSLSSYIESIFYNLISNSIKFRSFTKNLIIDIHSEIKNDTIKIYL